MLLVDWNALGFKYEFNYRKVGGELFEEWIVERFNSIVDKFIVFDFGYYKFWEFRIRVVNNEGLGFWSFIE